MKIHFQVVLRPLWRVKNTTRRDLQFYQLVDSKNRYGTVLYCTVLYTLPYGKVLYSTEQYKYLRFVYEPVQLSKMKILFAQDVQLD